MSADQGAPPSYRQPLTVQVVWHPRSRHGESLARTLYDHLTRDVQNPLARGLSIPVYFRSLGSVGADGPPEMVPFDEARHTAVVVLVDAPMVIGGDQGWARHVVELQAAAAASGGAHRVLPVMLSPFAFDLSPELARSNFIHVTNPGEELPETLADELPEHWAQNLLIGVTHELCRLALAEERLDHEGDGGRVTDEGRRVRLFLSHASKDGEHIAQAIRDGIRQSTQLDTFFDANDIPFGEDFEQVLQESLESDRIGIVCIQTDSYSSSVWCQREVLWAKRCLRPVLIVHAVRRGEKCSFPYLGNAPTLRCDGETPDVPSIVLHALLEFLRSLHFLEQCRDLLQWYGTGRRVHILPQAPELLTLLELRHEDVESTAIDPAAPAAAGQTTTVIYPEPPLGEHLTELLGKLDPDLELVTPVLLATRTAEGRQELDDVLVALSLGDSPDLAQLGFADLHATDAAREFARYLLETGADLAYGGNLRPGGFTELLRDLVRTYDASIQHDTPRLIGYLAWHAHRDTLRDSEEYPRWSRSPTRIQFEFCEWPGNDADLPDPTVDYSPWLPENRTPERLLVAARALTAMRERMTAEQQARVVLGGKLTGFSGRYPGILEESLLALRAGQPLYLCGAFGGCAQAVIEGISRRPSLYLTQTFQFQDETYLEMTHALADLQGVEFVDYTLVNAELAELGVDGLAEQNGLSVAENERLFVTPHVTEMIHLVLRGLVRLRHEGRVLPRQVSATGTTAEPDGAGSRVTP